MQLNFMAFLLFLSFNATKCNKPCPESKKSITYVPSCPKTLEEFKWRANAKKCWQVNQQCTRPEGFEYHCVINSYANATLEVCAQKVSIIGHSCVEFNMLGGLIQESPYYNCSKSCPFSYNSTDVYKYQTCFKIKDLKSENNCSHCNCATVSQGYEKYNASFSREMEECHSSGYELVWQIVAAVLLIIIVVLLSTMFWSWKTKKAREEEQKEQEYLLDEGQRRARESEESYHSLKSESSANKQEPVTGQNRARESKGISAIKSESSAQKTEPVNCSWVSSIDIGDTYCGMAYLDPKNPEDVIAVGKIERISVLMTKEGKMECFGESAREMYISGKQDKLKKCIYIDQLKLDEKEISVGKCKFQTIGIYKQIITYLLCKIRGEIDKTTKPKGTPPDICYVFTVPKHWGEHIENLRNAILNAEIPPHEKIKKEKLHIKFRRVAISPYIHEVRAAVLCLNFNVDNLTFKQNTTYGLLHVGSTYCSLLFMDVVDLKKPDVIYKEPYREKYKSSLEDRFMEIFEEIFKPKAVEKWKQKFHREYVELLDKFEKYKIRMYENTEDNEPFQFVLSEELPEIEMSLYRSQRNELEKTVAGKSGMELKITGGKYNFILSWHLLKSCFQDVIDGTDTVIKHNEKVFKEKEVHCVIMTGMYSQMKYLQKEAEKKWFYGKHITVAIPVDAGSIFAIGAAYYMKRFPDWKDYDDKYGI